MSKQLSLKRFLFVLLDLSNSLFNSSFKVEIMHRVGLGPGDLEVCPVDCF